MKTRTLCSLLFLTLSFQVFALRPGDRATELAEVKMIRGQNLRLAPEGKNYTPPPLRAVIFILCRAVNARSTIAMLDDLRRAYPEKLAIEVLTPDSAADAEALRSATADSKIALGVDPERRITQQYMAGSLIYPMAFLIDRRGIIVWCGEAVDLAEKIPTALDGKLSVSDEAKIAELTEELQQLLRDNSEIRMKRIADRIFSIDPGNAAALRIRLFTLENTGRIDAARELLDARLKEAPKLPRLYFTAVDFAARYGSSDAELERIVSNFERHVNDSATRVRMAWLLLERFPYHPSALKASARMLRQPLPEAALPRANAAAGRAVLEYRLGNIGTALELQQEAVKILNQAGSSDELNGAKAREAYFRTVLELKKP